jgi:multidrug efflux pump
VKLAELCIKRPVFAIVVSLIPFIVGLLAFDKLDIRFLPQIERPEITIRTSYPGASPSLVESDLTALIENQISGIEGIETIESVSLAGFSRINLILYPNVNPEQVSNEITSRLQGLRQGLPEGADNPFIRLANTDSDPSLYISVADPNQSRQQLVDYVDRQLKPSFEQLPGVGGVLVWGGDPYVLRVSPNPEKMLAQGVTVADIMQALQDQNIQGIGGSIYGDQRQYTINLSSQIKQLDDFNKIILARRHDHNVRLGDVAQVHMGSSQLHDSQTYIDGQSGILLALQAQPSANPMALSQAAKDLIARLTPGLPAGMSLELMYDTSSFIKLSLDEIYEAIFIAVLLVMLIIYLFLGNMRAAFIPIITIPLCLVTSFALISLFGFTINNMTLLALLLAVGLVVDDAIVVVENSYHHLQQGAGPLNAAFKSSKQIGGAIIAMTLTLAAVYVPLGFNHNLTGQLIREFAFTLAGAVAISGVIALTLALMLCGNLLKPYHEIKTNRLVSRFNHWLNQLEILYAKGLQLALKFRYALLLVMALVLLSIYGAYQLLPQALVPKEDLGSIRVVLRGHADVSADAMNRYAEEMTAVLAKIPDIDHYFVITGFPRASRSFAMVTLKPWGERRPQQQVISELRNKLSGFVGVSAYVIPMDPLPGNNNVNRSQDISFQVKFLGSYQDLADLAEQLGQQLVATPMFTDVNTDLTFDSNQFDISINRDLANHLGVNVKDLVTTLEALLGGKQVGQFYQDSNAYDVVVQLNRNDLSTLAALDRLHIRTDDGQQLALSNLIKVNNVVMPQSLSRYDRSRSAEMQLSLASGYSLGQAVDYLTKELPELLPANAQYSWSGSMVDFIKSQNDAWLLFVLAFVFIYLVLAAQFESFIDPFAILGAVPLSIMGALWTLYWQGGSLSIYSQIGLITLIGLIAKHGILIVTFANQLQQQGEALWQAVTQAAKTRLRPILMTTAATVFGAIPLVIAFGPGAASRGEIGWVVIGGMVFGTVFCLFLVPIAYVLLDPLKSKRKRISESAVELAS